MNKKLQLILFILLFLVLVYIFHNSFSNNEHYRNTKSQDSVNKNYCQSASNRFIVVSDPDDPRCIKNQKNNKSKDNSIIGFIPCINNGRWGLKYGSDPKCYPLSFFGSRKEGSGTGSDNSEDGDDSTTSKSTSKSKLSESEYKKNKKLKEELLKCEKTKLPNSGPCFTVVESFENFKSQNDLSLDEKCQLYNKNPDFGFYKMQTINGKNSIACRKYYKSQNNDSTITGIYKPTDYGIYVSPSTSLKSGYNMSGCYPKDTDFNEMCRAVNKDDNYGTYKILNGADGNCYDPNNEYELKNYANAICSVNHETNIPKLSPGALGKIPFNPNYFTKCIPFQSSIEPTFQKECDKIQIKGYPLKAYQIDSYDCPPGQGRAKCKYNA